MPTATELQQQLLAQAQQIYYQTPISDTTARAFLAAPRHQFVRRYREWASRTWHEVTPDNVDQHLAALYADNALTLFGDDDDEVPSTISQPSFVLRMLDLLQVEPGHTVLEVGTGSGWNAALLGRLAAPSGTVWTVEIIPRLAEEAVATLAEQGITNVHVVPGDGGGGHAAGGPYDRAAFTAGAYDLPRPFYDQMKPGGLLLAVIKNEGGSDNLVLLRKAGDHFESIYSTSCGFVPLTGKYNLETLNPVPVESLPEWPYMQERQVGRRPFWWGGKGAEFFRWQTAGIRSFLGITDPAFRAFKTPKVREGAMDYHYFGLWDVDERSLVIARDDELISYGSLVATERLLASVHRWVDLGMPSASSFSLRVYPADRCVPAGEREWIVRRPESQFVWRLEL